MQRYVRMFGTPITLLVLLLILFLGARWGYRNVVAPAPPPPLVPCTQQTVGSALKAGQVQLTVQNGGTTVGLATTVANQLRAKGFVVTGTGNSTEKVTTTTVVGASATSPEVKLVASQFKGAKVVADGRVDHTVEVRVGSPKTGFDTTAGTSLPLDRPTVCLPAPIATPSA